MKKLLLIDDDVNLCTVLSHQLRKNGYDVTTANSGEDGLARFGDADFDIVITDIQMPDLTGIQVLKAIRRRNREVIVIIITAHGSIDNALEACDLGADDYLTKPFGKEQLLFVIEKAVRLRTLQEENSELRQELTDKYHFENLVARSAGMEDVLRMAGKVAASDANVLVLGESGTGKELVSRAIHYNSPRREKPLVVVNCPSIPDNLLESELFGHVKGAYTGAVKDRKGKFETAEGGSIFLDEIGDLREEVQAKLLRVLQEHEIERLGESKPIPVDVRIIAATNKDLERLVAEGKFREDLFYRLSVVPLTIPPLRERREEIPYLVDFFLNRHAPNRPMTVDPEVITVLQRHDWPGNIRELENAIERAVVLSSENHLTIDSLPPHLGRKEAVAPVAAGIDATAEGFSLEQVERQAIQEALKRAGGNRSEAARILKVPRHILLYRLKKLGLE